MKLVPLIVIIHYVKIIQEDVYLVLLLIYMEKNVKKNVPSFVIVLKEILFVIEIMENVLMDVLIQGIF